jgi:hypothetical protein
MRYKLTRNQNGAIKMDLNGQSVPNWMVIWGSQDSLWWNRFETQHALDLIRSGRFTMQDIETAIDAELDATSAESEAA